MGNKDSNTFELSKGKKDLIDIIRNVICRDGTEIPQDVDWEIERKLAKYNHLEAIVFHAAPEEKKDALSDDYYRCVTMGIRQECLLAEIESVLSEAYVVYAPQKGSILRNDYPEPVFRYMSDIDLYIDPADRDKIRQAVGTIGGKLSGTESGDEQFIFPPNLGVEFHGRLLYRKTKNGIENYPDRSMVDGKRNRLTEEGFALNLIGHAVYNLSKGGLGVRYVLDLWIYRHRHAHQPDWDSVWERLKKDNIDRAAKNLFDLSEYFWGNGEKTDLLAELAEYVLSVGLHGDKKRGVLSEVANSGGKMNAIGKQVFRDREEYENRYQWLKKYPFLLPAAWVARAFNSLKNHRSEIGSWLKTLNRTQSREMKEHNKRLKRFGL